MEYTSAELYGKSEVKRVCVCGSVRNKSKKNGGEEGCNKKTANRTKASLTDCMACIDPPPVPYIVEYQPMIDYMSHHSFYLPHVIP